MLQNVQHSITWTVNPNVTAYFKCQTYALTAQKQSRPELKNIFSMLIKYLRSIPPILVAAFILTIIINAPLYVLNIIVLFFVISLTVFFFWICPSCGKLFFTKHTKYFVFSFIWPYRNKCVHCGNELNKKHRMH